MQWYRITLSWDEVMAGRHRELATSIEKCFHKASSAEQDIEIKIETLSGGALRLYTSPGVMEFAGEIMEEVEAEACQETPSRQLSTFLLLSRG